MKLLGVGQNAKTVKGDKSSEYLTAILYLAPHKSNSSGVNLCPKASSGCAAACLYTAGRGAFTNVQNARLRKADWFVKDRSGFLAQLNRELASFVKKCTREGRKPAVRLNGTSDIDWPRHIDMAAYPEVIFYDYTKVKRRLYKYAHIKNYHLTFSRDESSKDKDIKEILKDGHNVAVVFNHRPSTYLGHKVIDGDAHDIRFSDGKGVVVGLLPKGEAKKDTSGFVIHLE